MFYTLEPGHHGVPYGYPLSLYIYIYNKLYIQISFNGVAHSLGGKFDQISNVLLKKMIAWEILKYISIGL